MNGSEWAFCPKCQRKLFRWGEGGIEIAPGARVMQPMDRAPNRWVVRPDEVAIVQCPKGHMVGPPQPPVN